MGLGYILTVSIGSHLLDHIDTFVLLDEIRNTNPDDYIAGFPTHPHRGIETITYMLHGSFSHRDSRGGGGVITDGCVQWMTAGGGILHSEMPEATEGELWGYQLWLSLPAEKKLVKPHYQHLFPEMMPVLEQNGMRAVVISGELSRQKGLASNWVKTHYFDVTLKQGSKSTFELDEVMNAFAYVHTGVAVSNSERVHECELAEFGGGRRIAIKAMQHDAGFLFLAANPNNEPIVRGGPFVMNTKEEIQQAYADYRKGSLW